MAHRLSGSTVASALPEGTAIRMRTIAAASSRAKAIPAIPAARGVLSRSVVGSMNPSLSPPVQQAAAAAAPPPGAADRV
ncbi:hypothetical protein SF23_09985, partial [Streptomyces sp. MBRL 10]